MCYGKDQKKLIVCKRNENPKTGAISSCFLKLTLETRDNAQIEQIRQELTKAGFQLVAERV